MKKYINSVMFLVINEHVHNSRDRKVLKDRFLNGYSIEFLAEKYELSATQVQRKIQDYKDMLLDEYEDVIRENERKQLLLEKILDKYISME